MSASDPKLTVCVRFEQPNRVPKLTVKLLKGSEKAAAVDNTWKREKSMRNVDFDDIMKNVRNVIEFCELMDEKPYIEGEHGPDYESPPIL